MKNGPTPAFVLARATALTAPAWLPVSGLRQSAEAVSSPGSLLLHVASEGVVISVPDKALALAAGTDPGQHARLQPSDPTAMLAISPPAMRGPRRAGAMLALGRARQAEKATPKKFSP